MPTYILISQTQVSGANLQKQVRDFLVQNNRLNPTVTKEIPAWEALPFYKNEYENFLCASSFITKQLKELPSTETLTAVVDEVEAWRLDSVDDMNWSSFIAMLVLAFPEVRWCFLNVAGIHNAEHPEFFLNQHGMKDLDKEKVQNLINDTLVLTEYYSIKTLVKAQGTPLFDGYGLRKLIRRQINEAGEKKSRDPVSVRRYLATVLDEETDFNLFEALTAYCRGFRVHAISSLSEAKALLGETGVLRNPSPRPAGTVPASRAAENRLLLLSFEDLYLHFPDGKIDGMSNIDKRNEVLPALDTSETPHLKRRFVTSGHFQGDNEEKESKMNIALEKLAEQEEVVSGRKVPKKNLLVKKPVSGLYALWAELGLKEAFPNKGGSFLDGDAMMDYRDFAPEFIWPPKKPESNRYSPDGGGHGAPGRLLQIAECLLERAAVLVENVRSVADAVRGAVLATDAMELIGCKTPSETLKALDLKHRFEIYVECYFSGMEYHLAVEERMKDILQTLDASSVWLSKERKKDYVLNGQAKILSHLIEILEAHGSFEETEKCRDELRDLQKEITLKKCRKRYGLVLSFVPELVVRYFYWIIRSIPHLLTAVAIWGIVTILMNTFILYFGAEPHFFGNLFNSAYVIGCAMFTEAADFPKEKLATILENTGGGFYYAHYLLKSFVIALGFFHFGIAISLFYSKLSRK